MTPRAADRLVGSRRQKPSQADIQTVRAKSRDEPEDKLRLVSCDILSDIMSLAALRRVGRKVEDQEDEQRKRARERGFHGDYSER